MIYELGKGKKMENKTTTRRIKCSAPSMAEFFTEETWPYHGWAFALAVVAAVPAALK